MNVLALDTATPACQVAVVALGPESIDPASGARTLATRSVVDARRAGEVLPPSIEAALAAAGLRPADLDAVAVGLGPGPYTGLRVGIVTAAAFGDALGVPVYGVCSLDALAPAAGRVAAVIDGRRREVYWAVYDGGGRVHGPAVGRPAEVVGELAAFGVTAVTGDGAQLYAETFGALVDEGGPRYPDPVAIARLVAPAALAGAPGTELTPLDLRRPDAAQPHPPKPVAV